MAIEETPLPAEGDDPREERRLEIAAALPPCRTTHLKRSLSSSPRAGFELVELRALEAGGLVVRELAENQVHLADAAMPGAEQQPPAAWSQARR